MGNAWSKFQSAKTCSVPIDCSKSANGLAAAAGGAGIGTLIAFALSAGINVCLSVIVIISQWNGAKKFSYQRLDKEHSRWRDQQQERTKRGWVMQQLILSFSDQQLIQGLAMAVTARYFTSCSRPISAYHYDLICYLLTCSIVTHLCSIVAVNQYFDPFSGSKGGTLSRLIFLIVRCTGIAVTIILSGLILWDRDATRFPVEHPASKDDTERLLLRPAACFFVGADSAKEIVQNIPDVLSDWKDKNWSHGLVQYVIFLLGIMVAVPVAFFQSIYHAVRMGKPARKPILILRLLVVLTGFVILVWNLVLAWTLRAWMHSSNWLEDAEATENAWNYSQILTLLVILFAPFALFDALAEKYDARKQIALLEAENNNVNIGDVAFQFARAENIAQASHSGWPI